jgi:hypothetical protein
LHLHSPQADNTDSPFLSAGASLFAPGKQRTNVEIRMNAGNRILLVSSLAIVLGTFQLARAAEPTDSEKIRAADQAVREKLRREIKLDVVETPFADVLMELNKTLDITIILDPEGLEESDVTPDQLISLNLKDKRADAIFRVLLEPLHLECGVRDGLLIITSREKYERDFLAVRVFDVHELLDKAATSSKPLPSWKKPARKIGGMSAGLAAGGSAAPPVPVAPPPVFEPETPADHFVAMICDSIAPHSWTHRGGHATAKVFGGVLVVRQTEEALAEIGDLVDQMRRATSGGDPESK